MLMRLCSPLLVLSLPMATLTACRGSPAWSYKLNAALLQAYSSLPMPIYRSSRGALKRCRVSSDFSSMTAHRSRPKTNAHSGFAMASGSEAVPEEFVEVANRLADAASTVISRYFRSDFAIEAKGDETPVTIADREAEAEMRKILAEAFPDHGIFGEEEGLHLGESGSGFLWVLDPIDGTKSFITGKPLFGTLIALLDKGHPVLGIIDQPILKERWQGVRGRQSTLNGNPIETRSCEDVREAYLYATSPHMFQGHTVEAFERVREQVLQPLYGCDCYAYGLLASGFCDLVVEADMKAYDYMAQIPIVEGAGGVITDWLGNPLRWPMTPSNTYAMQELPGEILAAGDKRAHEQALKHLDWQEGGTYEQTEENIDVTFQS